jgi:hypothetical protein
MLKTCLSFSALCVFFASGCVTRTLVVDTVPPGAEIWINDEPAGVSPVEAAFTQYGTHRVAARMKGYKTVERSEKISCPWYGYPPFDLFAEVLWPGNINDRREVRVTLERVEENDAPKPADLADRLRKQQP